MSIMENAIGGDFLTTATSPLFELGTTMKGASGSEWVYVQANGAITGAGYVVTIDEAFQATMITTTNGLFGDIVGVPGVAFADNAYGWVQRAGPCVIRVAASCAANVWITTTATAGELDDAAGTGTKDIRGAALTTANGGSAGIAAGQLNYPVVGDTNA